MADTDVLLEVWRCSGGDEDAPGAVRFDGDAVALPGIVDVAGFAAGAVAAATLAVAEVHASRLGAALPPVRVGRRAAVAAFRSEALLAPDGWELPPVWDPIAGDYRAADGWIRLHTNYAHHRDAALRALGLPPGDRTTRDAVERAVAGCAARELEDAVVAGGGCAAALRTAGEWAKHPQGAAVAAEPVLTRRVRSAAAGESLASRDPAAGLRRHGERSAPLAGVRVLDLTRVIAGPAATRALAWWGADVLRIDPPGFAEVPALLPDVTAGKRRAALDLAARDGRTTFERLLRSAHVLVHGLRPGALEALGLGPDRLRSVNPALVTAGVSAYGWTGPWAGRRGFDSLVQLSTGLAARPGDGPPVALPAQALDHGAGQLLVAAAGRGLADLLRTGTVTDARVSLAGVARLLAARPHAEGAAPVWDDGDTVAVGTAWGPARAVPVAGTIGGRGGSWRLEAGPLGSHAPHFATAPPGPGARRRR